MQNAFVYMFKEKNFWKKYLTIFLFITVSNFLINWNGLTSPFYSVFRPNIMHYIIYFLGYSFLLIPYGYFVSALNNFINMENCTKLPKIEFFKNFLEGLKFIASMTLLVFLCFFILVILNIIKEAFPENNNFVTIIFYTLCILLYFIASFFSIGMTCKYAKNRKFITFLDFKSVSGLINNNIKKYFFTYIIINIIGILIGITSGIILPGFIAANILGITIYSAVLAGIWTYILFSFIYLYGNAVEQKDIL